MQEYHDEILGKIIINKITNDFDIDTEITYNINMGFF